MRLHQLNRHITKNLSLIFIWGSVATASVTHASSPPLQNLIQNGEFIVSETVQNNAANKKNWFLRPQDKIGFVNNTPQRFAAPLSWDVRGGGLKSGNQVSLPGWAAENFGTGQGALLQNNNGGWPDDAFEDNLNAIAAIRFNDHSALSTTISKDLLEPNTSYQLALNIGVNTPENALYNWPQLRDAIIVQITDGHQTVHLNLSDRTSAPMGFFNAELRAHFTLLWTTSNNLSDLIIQIGSRDSKISNANNAHLFGFDNLTFMPASL